MLRWMAAVLICMGLTGCGQKGALYLPPLAEQSQAEQPNSEQAQPAQP